MRAVLYRGKWCAAWTEDGRTRRRSLRIGGNPEDRALARRIIAESRREPVGETVGAIMEAYLTERDHTAASPGSLRYAWEAMKTDFAPLLPEHITADLCREHIAKRRKQKRKDGTIRKELSTLRTGLRWGKAEPSSFAMPPMPPPKDRHLTRKQYNRLVASTDVPHVRLFIILAVATAGRTSALLSLTWDRVEFKRGLIMLAAPDDKTRKGRATVPMTERARKALEEAHKVALTDYVIEYASRQVKSVKTGFRSAVAKAGLKDVTPHVLRHTSAVWMAEAGVSMPEIAAYLGHADSAITERVYARFSPEYLRKAAGALE